MQKSIAKLEYKRFEVWANWKILHGAILIQVSRICVVFKVYIQKWLLKQQISLL